MCCSKVGLVALALALGFSGGGGGGGHGLFARAEEVDVKDLMRFNYPTGPVNWNTSAASTHVSSVLVTVSSTILSMSTATDAIPTSFHLTANPSSSASGSVIHPSYGASSSLSTVTDAIPTSFLVPTNMSSSVSVNTHPSYNLASSGVSAVTDAIPTSFAILTDSSTSVGVSVTYPTYGAANSSLLTTTDAIPTSFPLTTNIPSLARLNSTHPPCGAKPSALSTVTDVVPTSMPISVNASSAVSSITSSFHALTWSFLSFNTSSNIGVATGNGSTISTPYSAIPSKTYPTVLTTMNGTTVTETKTVYSKPSDSSVMLSFTSSSSHVTTIKQTSTYAIHVSKTIASAPSHALASALPTPVLSSKSSEIAIPQGVSSTPSVVAAPSQPSLDSCPIICKPTVCTDNVVLRGTPTLLVYLCSGTKAPHGESTPASVAMASSSSTVGRSTMWFSSTPIGSSEIGSSSTLGISSAMPSSSKVHSTVFVTVTEITTVTPVSTTIATPTSMELTTTITHHLTSTLFKTHTIFPHPTSIPSGVFWTGFPSGYFPTHPAGLSGTYSVNSARIAARNVLTVTVTAPPSTVFENITATPTHPVSVSTDNVMGPSVTVTQNMKKGDAAEIAEVSVIAFCMVILAAVLLL